MWNSIGPDVFIHGGGRMVVGENAWNRTQVHPIDRCKSWMQFV
jgi:hypothetical protein